MASMTHYYRKQLNVFRMLGTPVLRPYHLAEHSYFVGLLWLDLMRSVEAPVCVEHWDLVLKHDLLETLTADLPYPVKNLSTKAREAWQVIEDEAILNWEYKTGRPFLYSDERLEKDLSVIGFKAFKIADMLEFWLYCMEERKLGNHTIEMTKCLEKARLVLDNYISDFPLVGDIIKEFAHE